MPNMIILRGRLPKSKRIRLRYLLDMLYTPSEIATEVGFSRRQFYRVYLPAGCPHTQNKSNRIFVNGKDFCEWYIRQYPAWKPSQDEVFCLTCKSPVPLINPVRQEKNNAIFYTSNCPHCGRRLAKFIEFGYKKNDQSEQQKIS